MFTLISFPLPNGLWSTIFDVTSPDVVSIQPAAVDTSEARKSRNQVVFGQENTNVYISLLKSELRLHYITKKKVLI